MQIRSQQVRSQRLAVTLLAGAAFLSGLDLFVVNVAFDDIGRAVGAGAPGGPRARRRQLDPHGVRRRLRRLPGALRQGGRQVAAPSRSSSRASRSSPPASLACAATGDLWFLVAARAVQAIGAAAMTPTSLSLLLAVAPAGAPAARGVRPWASAGAIAAAVGRRVGGLLTQLDWRLVFVINLPVGSARARAGRHEGRHATPREPSAAVPDFLRPGCSRPGSAAFALAPGPCSGLGLGLHAGAGAGSGSRWCSSPWSPYGRAGTRLRWSAPRCCGCATFRWADRGHARLQRGLRRQPAGRGALAAAGLGLVAPAHRAGHRARTGAGAGHGLADPPLPASPAGRPRRSGSARC